MASDEPTVSQIQDAIAADGLTWEAEENALTRMSAEDRRGHLGLLVTPAEMTALTAQTTALAAMETASLGAEDAVAVPARVDWRTGGYVTPVKDQQSCGSCVAFCTCSVIESGVRIKLNNPQYEIDLSEGFLQFCGGGSCNGWGLTSGLSFAQSTGVVDEACMPYEPRNMSCQTSRCSDWANRLTKISGFSAHATMAARKEAVAKGPVVAGMEVWSDFFSYNGKSVYVKSSAATRLNPPGYHCICVIGYDDAEQCWIVKNSWGTANWGAEGFGRIGYGQTDLLIDSSWSFYSADVNVGPVYQSTTVAQVYASRDAQNAWANLSGLGWRRILPGAADGVTNMHLILTEAAAKKLTVTVLVDGTNIHQVYL